MNSSKIWKIGMIVMFLTLTMIISAEEEVLGSYNLNPGERELAPGDEGADVALLQRELADRGYYDGSIDGLYGPRTEEAVKRFQDNYDLVTDGRLDITVQKSLSSNKLVSKYSVSRNELMTLARIIHGEARGENFRGMVAVGAVIVNRVEDHRFPDNIHDVISEDGQFSSLMDGQANLYPDQESRDAARAALTGYDPSRQSYFFYNPEVATNLAWISQRPIVQRIGDHVFAR